MPKFVSNIDRFAPFEQGNLRECKKIIARSPDILEQTVRVSTDADRQIFLDVLGVAAINEHFNLLMHIFSKISERLSIHKVISYFVQSIYFESIGSIDVLIMTPQIRCLLREHSQPFVCEVLKTESVEAIRRLCQHQVFKDMLKGNSDTILSLSLDDAITQIIFPIIGSVKTVELARSKPPSPVTVLCHDDAEPTVDAIPYMLDSPSGEKLSIDDYIEHRARKLSVSTCYVATDILTVAIRNNIFPILDSIHSSKLLRIAFSRLAARTSCMEYDFTNRSISYSSAHNIVRYMSISGMPSALVIHDLQNKKFMLIRDNSCSSRIPGITIDRDGTAKVNAIHCGTDERIIKLALNCNAEASFIITDSSVYFSSHSQRISSMLTRASKRHYPPDKEAFCPIDTLRGLGVIDIAETESHAIFLATDKVLCCGNNSFGALGIEDKTYLADITEITSLREFEVCDIGTNTEFSLFLTSSGQLLISGKHPNGTMYHSPVLLEGLADEFVTSICMPSASCSCLILCNSGRVYALGENKNYNLGVPGTVSIKEPTLIPALRHIRITKISSSATHSLFLSDDGTVLSCGMNYSGEVCQTKTIYKRGRARLKSSSAKEPMKIIGLEGIKHIYATYCGSSFIDISGNVFTTSNIDMHSGELFSLHHSIFKDDDGTHKISACTVKLNTRELLRVEHPTEKHMPIRSRRRSKTRIRKSIC